MKHSKKPVFSQKGLNGFGYKLANNKVEVYYVDVSQGHETYITSKKCFHIYYVLGGKGTFDLNNETIGVSEGDLIEVKPDIKYTYSGKMKLLLIMNPPWFEGNEEVHEKNPNVI
jgi:quercetin dioxygenase-like cupin family protein